MDINRNNYEGYLLLYLDRELNTSDQAAVENFLKENTDLQKEFRLLQNTVQYPAEIIFEHKEALYHKEEKRRIIPAYWMRMAAAISLILAGTWFLMTTLKNPKMDVSGKKVPVATIGSKKIPETGAAKKILPGTQSALLKNEPDQFHTREKNMPSSQNMAGQTREDVPVNDVSVNTANGLKEQKQNSAQLQNRQPDNRSLQAEEIGKEQIKSNPVKLKWL